jgi:hypothetical protein
MKMYLLFFIPVLLFGERIFDSTFSPQNKEAMNNPKIKCRMVCDKKLYRQQEITKAISFYQNSKRYKFSTNGFDPLK